MPFMGLSQGLLVCTTTYSNLTESACHTVWPSDNTPSVHHILNLTTVSPIFYTLFFIIIKNNFIIDMTTIRGSRRVTSWTLGPNDVAASFGPFVIFFFFFFLFFLANNYFI